MVGAANIFRALSNSPQALKGFANLGGRLLFRSALPGRAREAVILRMGAMNGSNYEWGQHVLIGREQGLNDDEIRGIRDGSLAGLDEAEQAAVRYGEAVEERRVDQPLWDATRKHYDDKQMTELTVLAGFYGLVSRFLIATDVQLDDGVQGLDHP
jgi:alkylhydroperoxidase family enzyme